MMCSEEVGLAEWTVALVTGLEPLADAADVELVLAVLTRHAGQRLVRRVEHAVADEALFHAVDLLIDITLPQQHCRYNVTVPDLQQVADGQSPLVLLAIADLDLLTDLNSD